MHAVNPALLTMVAATVVGLLAQVIAARWRIPSIVPLLVFGMVLGPSGANFIRPQDLGTGLSVVVKLSVAVILFQGALNLRLGDLRNTLREVRSLVTIGVAVTWVGATLAAWFIAGLTLRVAIVFGALLTVTGPTVVQPILRRVRLPRQLKTILEGEAILIDPIGAVLAVAVVDVVLGLAGVRPIGILGSIWGYAGRLIVGAIVGASAGLLLSWLLKRRGLIPDELSNLVSLASVWGAYALAEVLQGESGIMAVVAMGLTMQHGAVPEERRLRKFKEQLTVLGISLLFVLLSANLPLGVVRAEGMRGLLTVAVLMFIVRPVSVWCALHRTDLTWRDRAFISWISPRGVVAASVASLFALELTEAGFPEGERILALTFLTIAATVVVQGLTAGPVARLLRLESFAGRNVVLVGAGPMARAIAGVLRRYDRPVTLIDRNAMLVDDARDAGFDAVAGNALDEEVLSAAGTEDAETVIAMTTNSEVNALAAHLAHDGFGVAGTYPALANPEHGASAQLLDRVGGDLAFGRPIDVREWDFAFAHGAARIVVFRIPAGIDERPRLSELPTTMVSIARVRARSIEIATSSQTWRGDDHVVVATTLSETDATETLHELTAGRYVDIDAP
ncbi:MAG TPA: cation:proton antiporter [Gemmatimonadaceae bacterium]|jgi:NhaP-type Na+/H+ or K+/H+ antiporter